MAGILIHSHADDLHADAILWGLGSLGLENALWCADDFPEAQTLSIHISPTRVQHRVERAGCSADLGSVRTVWNRRHGRLKVSSSLDSRDRQFADDQSRHHVHGFLTTACGEAMWVNSPAASSIEFDKARQLVVAREVGFAVPATLLSNSPDEILSFYDEQGGDIIYKPFRGGVWTEGGRVSANYTARVTRDELDRRESLMAAPGIFQRRIDKAFEARVTVMGQTIFAIRIASSHDDWRIRTQLDARFEPLELPGHIVERCREFMARTGLLFGCFDFIATPAGEYYFLEVNQMGQFLWKEKHVPDLPLLDSMCAFLASSDPRFTYRPRRKPLRFEDYAASEQHRRFMARSTAARAAALATVE